MDIPTCPSQITPNWISDMLMHYQNKRGDDTEMIPLRRTVVNEGAKVVNGEETVVNEEAKVLNGGKRVVDVDVTGQPPGKNYCSEIYFVRVTLAALGRNGETEVKHLVVKMLPRDSRMRASVLEDLVHEREIFFYTEVAKDMFDLAEKFGISLGIPRMFYAAQIQGKGAVTVLEDISPRGFILQSQYKGLDFRHIRLVLRQMARFHAVGLVLKHTSFVSLKARYPLLRSAEEFGQESHYTRLICHNANLFCEMLEDTGEDVLVKILRKRFVDDFFIKFLAALQAGLDEYVAIAHGDLWTNNILFRYDENNVPVDVMLVDFQFVAYVPIIRDLVQFFVTSTEPEQWVSKYKHLLSLYWKDLTNTWKEMGYEDLEQTFGLSLNSLIACFQQNLPFGFYVSVSSGVIILTGGFHAFTSEDNPFLFNQKAKERTRAVVDEMFRLNMLDN